ncbi:MAG: hypothetical protein IPM21_03215 [Acidobacteria bacterium]|nr:hypothetical protein [Acidobacteriota bacterium]
MKIEEIRSLKDYVVEWSEPGRHFLSRRNEIFECREIGGELKKIGKITAPGWKELASRSRLAQRLFRFMVANLLPLPNGEIFITFDKSVGVFSADGEYRELKGLERPCRVLRSAAAVADDGNVYFGEYLDNAERGEMRIYRFTPGSDELETAYKFGKGEIRHIHGIYLDPFDRSLVCLTGDADPECRMLRSRDGFTSVEQIGGGDESWRAVSVLFTEKAMYYGTDAEYRENEIIRFDRDSGERKVLGKVSGTVFYSRKVGDNLLFGTTAEDAPAQKENVAAIFSVDRDDNLTEVVKFPKDRWHKALFQFGTIAFASPIELPDSAFFSLVATNNDSRTFRIA